MHEAQCGVDQNDSHHSRSRRYHRPETCRAFAGVDNIPITIALIPVMGVTCAIATVLYVLFYSLF